LRVRVQRNRGPGYSRTELKRGLPPLLSASPWGPRPFAPVLNQRHGARPGFHCAHRSQTATRAAAVGAGEPERPPAGQPRFFRPWNCRWRKSRMKAGIMVVEDREAHLGEWLALQPEAEGYDVGKWVRDRGVRFARWKGLPSRGFRRAARFFSTSLCWTSMLARQRRGQTVDCAAACPADSARSSNSVRR